MHSHTPDQGARRGYRTRTLSVQHGVLFKKKIKDFGVTDILPLNSCLNLASLFVKPGYTDLLQSGLED